MKKIVGDSKQIMSRYDARTRDEMIAMLDEEIAALPESERASAKFEIDEYGYQYDDNTYHALFLTWKRLETDEEEQKREAQESEQAARRAAYERAEYERLKKQFG